MNKGIAALLCLMSSATCLAEWTNCEAEDSTWFQNIAWNTEESSAKALTSGYRILDGTITLIRAHGEGTIHGVDAYEIIVFPTTIFPATTLFRAVAVSYVKHEGSCFLDAGAGNTALTCKSD